MNNLTLASDADRRSSFPRSYRSTVASSRGLWCALALALPALQPLLQPGVGVMADAAVHIFRVVELAHLLSSGVVFSRWAPDLVFGLGYPLFNFYPPLLYYAGASLNLAGLDVEVAVKLTLALIVLLGCAGTYGLARQWLGEVGAVLAAVAYTWSPFRLRELYFQGDFAQLLALGLAPVVLWALHRLVVTGKDRFAVAAALACAGLLLSHNISAMLLSPIILVYLAFLLALRRPGWRRAGQVFATLVAAGGLAAFFLLPALGEMGLVRVDALRSGDFDLERHFAPALDLIMPSVPLDANAVNPYVPYNLGLAQLIILLPAAVLLLGRRLRAIVLLNALALAACVFMMLPVSTPVWRAVPLLAFAEFPWRWLGPVALPLAFLVGAAAEALPKRSRMAFAVVGAVALILSAFPHLYPRQPFDLFAGSRVADVVNYEVTSGAVGTTSAGEYLPRSVERVPSTFPLVPAYASGAAIDRLDRGSLSPGASAQAVAGGLAPGWQVSAPTGFTARVFTLNYPGWTAYLDGAPVPVGTSGPEGLITVAVPAGEHFLALRFEDTDLRRLANAISLITVVVFVGLVGLRLRARGGEAAVAAEQQTTYRGEFGLPAALALVGLALALFVAKLAYIDPHTTWFRAATDLRQIPGLEQPLEVNFAGEVALLGYSVDKQVAAPGETVRVVLFWRALGPLERTYASFLHLGDERNDKRAQKDSPLPAGVGMQNWRPHQFARDEHLLTLPPDMAPGFFQFRVGLYDPRTLERPMVQGAPVNFALLKEPLRVSGPLPASARQQAFRLGEGIGLSGYRLKSETVRPGEEVELHLYWRVAEPVSRDYTVFVHLYDKGGKLWGAGDSQPLAGRYPTSRWAKGELVGDSHWVRLDPNAPPGDYTVAVGLYDLQTMQRLPVVDEGGVPQADNAVRFSPAVKAVAR